MLISFVQEYKLSSSLECCSPGFSYVQLFVSVLFSVSIGTVSWPMICDKGYSLSYSKPV